MTNREFSNTLVVLAAQATLLGSTSYAVSLSQLDDFEDGTNQNWGGGNPLTQAVINVADGGPDGVGDAYLSYTSSGSGGQNARMVIPNDDQWAGDYLAAGVSAIRFDITNQGNTTLDLRVAVGNGATWYYSTNPTQVAAGTDWDTQIFPLSGGALSLFNAGSDSLADVLANVMEVRLLSSVGTPSASFVSCAPSGDVIAASIGIDNVSAIPEPAGVTMVTLIGAAASTGRRARRSR